MKFKQLFANHESLNSTIYLESTLEQARLIEEHNQRAQRLNTVCIVSLIVLLIWSAIATVPQSAQGIAQVVPSKRLQIVQAVDGGILTDILVSEGDVVKVGQTIAQIDTTRFTSSLNEQMAVEASLRLREARLNALLNNEEFSPEETLRTKFPEIFQEELTLLESIRQEWQAQTQVYTQQMTQRQREKEEADSRAAAAQSAVSLLQQELNQMKPLLKTGAVSPVEILRIENKLVQSNGDLEASAAQSRRLASAIQEAGQKIQETQLQLQNKARAELSEVKGKLASLTQNKVELKDRVQQATLKSPVSGYIQRVLYSTKGAVVPPGQEVVEIIPSDDLLVFETRITPRDIGFIRPNQTATVRVTAYEYSQFGSLVGKVESISPDSLENEEGDRFYKVKVIVDKQSVNSEIELIPGMVAEVSIRTQDRTILSYLTKPITRGLRNALNER